MNDVLYVVLYYVNDLLEDKPDAAGSDPDKLKQFVVSKLNGGEELDWVDNGDSEFIATFDLNGDEACYKIVSVPVVN